MSKESKARFNKGCKDMVRERRAKSNQQFLNGLNLTLKVVLDKIEDNRLKKAKK